MARISRAGSYNANTILREPDWRKRDPFRALHLHAEDARALGLEAGQLAVCESAHGKVEARVEITAEHLPGVASLPHGYGMEEPQEDGGLRRVGPANSRSPRGTGAGIGRLVTSGAKKSHPDPRRTS